MTALPTLKLRVLPTFPSAVIGEGGVLVTKTNGVYSISLDQSVSGAANPTALVGLTSVNGILTTPMRSDAAPALSQAIIPTWTGAHTFNPTSGNAVTINPAANSYAKGVAITHTGPTSGSTAGPLAYDLIDITHSSAVTGSGIDGFGNSNSGTVGVRVNFTATGASLGAQGQIGMVVASRFTSAANAGGDKVSFAPTMYTNINASNSILYAINPYTAVGAAGSASAIIGCDVETNMAVGATVLTRFGLNVVNSGGAQASTLDTAIAITNNSSGGAGGAFKKLLSLSNRFGSAPLDTAADFFFADTAYTVANIFNLSNITVTGNILNFPNVVVTGAGRAAFGSATAPTAPNVVSATVASGGQSLLAASANTTSGYNGLDVLTSSGNNEINAIANEAARTGTHFGVTPGNYVEVTASGVSNLGMLFGTVPNTPIIIGTNNTERARVLAGLMVGTTTDPGAGIVNVATGYRVGNVALAPSNLSPSALAKTKVQKFTASGTYTPSAGLVSAIIECIGGGGGGGSSSGAVGQYYGGGGGGSGGYSRAYVTAATIGASLTITVGGGGNGGASGSNNGASGVATTAVASGPTTLCAANGGVGGQFGSNAQIGAGGGGATAGTGDVAGAGFNGSSGLYATITTVAFPSGGGASSAFGGGASGVQTASGTSLAGANASNYGAGGSGAISNSVAGSAAGGNGSTGIVIITEFTNQ